MPGNPPLNPLFYASPLVLIQEPGVTFIAHVHLSLSEVYDKLEFVGMYKGQITKDNLGVPLALGSPF